MEEAGFYDTPGLKLWRLKNAMWRAVRLMVDVDLHCRARGLDAASPTQPSSYVLGRNRIVELRKLAAQRADFDLADFHNWLLGYGSISPTFIPEPSPGALERA